MQCDMTGATIREHPDDPKSAGPFAEKGVCRCDATAVNATVERNINGNAVRCFDGCRLMIAGRLERMPDSWGEVSWPDVPLWADDKAESPVVARADELAQRPGKRRRITTQGVYHETAENA